MEADRLKWNRKFSERDDEPGLPEPFLLAHQQHLVPGTVLDLACGDGRNALYLAELGFEVLGVDISEVALERLARFAARRGLSVSTRRLDVDDLAELRALEPRSNVLLNHFAPSPELWGAIHRLAHPGGTVYCCAFGVREHEVYGFPRQYCLEPGQLLEQPELSLLSYNQLEDQGRYLDGYLFRRR